MENVSKIYAAGVCAVTRSPSRSRTASSSCSSAPPLRQVDPAPLDRRARGDDVGTDRDRSRQPGRYAVGHCREAFEDAAFADPSLPALDVDVVEELVSDAHAISTVDAPPSDTDEVRESREDDAARFVADRAVFTARADPATSARPGVPCGSRSTRGASISPISTPART